jgi:hypothetical protein
MIKTYGMRIVADHPEYGKIVKRREIPAGSKAEATEYARGWCIVQGYGVRPDSFTVETDGMTYRENMTRELTNAGARLSLSHGAVVIGPWEREPAYKGDEPRSIMRLIMPNGWGVSLSSKLSDAYSVDTSMVTGYPEDGEDWVCEFPVGALEYESRIMVAEEYDAEIGNVLRALAALPKK